MSNAFSNAVRLAALSGLKAVGAPLAAATLILFKQPLTKTPGGTVIGDIVEADFPGYAAEAGLAFGAPYAVGGGAAFMQAPAVEFTRTGGGASQTIYGWALTNVGKTALHYVAKLPEPVTLDVAGQTVPVVPVVQYGE